MKTNKQSKQKAEGTSPVSVQASSAKTSVKPADRKRSQKDDEKYNGSDYGNQDYEGKNFKDEDDYNSGKMGRGAEAVGEETIKDIPRRKHKNKSS